MDLFTGICDLKEKTLPRLRSIAITTNGLLTDRVARNTGEILKTLEGSDIGLVIVVAMDAVGGLHDRIRGFPGAWEKANITIGNLKDLQRSYPNLVVGLKTTILPLNVGELPKISSYAEGHGLFTIISPCIITEGRYLNPDKEAQMSFDPGQIRKMVDFYKQEDSGWQYHSQSLIQYYKTGRMKKPCSCGFNYLFIRSDGRVFPCPLLDVPLGNVLEGPVAEIYNSPEACRFRRRMLKCAGAPVTIMYA